MPLQTHSDFKSKVSDIQTAEAIDDEISDALFYQKTFEKTTTPWERHTWNYEKLQEITINVEKIDRLYYINLNRDLDISEYRLIARMNYGNNKFLYVDLDASCDYSGFDCQGGGTISVSKYPELFIKNIDISDDVKNFILEEVDKSSILYSDNDNKKEK